jgi:hypothetical protein
MFNAIGISPAIGGGAAAPAASLFAFYLDFKNANYWRDGTHYGAISAVPGYSYSDGVDNIPNIGASGYSNDTSSDFHFTPPFTVECDFIMYAIVNWSASTGADEAPLSISDNSFSNILSAYRAFNDSLRGYATPGAGAYPTGKSATSGRTVIALRRRSGKNTGGAKAADGSVALSAEDGAGVAFPAGLTRLQVGGFFSGIGQIAPGSFTEGVFVKLGTFSDGDMTALLTAA